MISGRPALFQARVRESGEVIQLDHEQMLALVQTDAELSEILMRAFILRRLELVASDLGDVVLIGSTHSPGTLRIKEFLTRNSHPYAYIDLDRDPDVQTLLDRFHVARGRCARLDLPRQHGAAKPEQSGDRRVSRLQRGDRSDARARRGDRRRRTVGPRRRGLRRVGGAGRPGAGGQRARRTGGLELENRKLPGLSHRHLGPGACRARLHAGAEIRRADHDCQGATD